MTKLLSLLVFLAILATSTAGAQSTIGDLVTFHDPTSVKILPDEPAKTVHFPVAYVEKTKPDSIKLAVESITRDGIQDEVFNGMFTAKWDGAAPAVTVNITLNAALRPGSYQIRIRLDGLIDDAQTTQTEQLIITIPAATVRSLGTLVVRQTKGLTGKPTITGAVLRLQETSRVSRLTELVVKQLSVESANGVKDGTQLAFDSLPTRVAPGGTARLNAALEGEFPLGQATGKLEVSASQLEQPYEVSFEVVTAVTKFALVLAIAIGIYVGYVVKTKVTLAMALSGARLQAADVLHRLQNPAYPDETFKAEINKLRISLEKAINDKDPQKISKERATAETTLASALQRLNARRATVQANLLRVEEDVTRHWQLPPNMETILETAKDNCRATQGLLDEGEVGKAEEMIDPLAQKMKENLSEAVAEWVSEMRDRFKMYPDNRHPLAILLTDQQAELQQFRVDLIAMSTDEMTDGFQQFLQRMSEYRRRLYRFLEGNILDVSKLIGNVMIKLAEKIDAVEVDKHVTELRDSRSIWQLEDVLEAVINKNDAIHHALKRSMLAVADTSIKQEVERLIDDGQYDEAADKILQLPQPASSTGIMAAGPALDLVNQGGGSGGAQYLYSLERARAAQDGQPRGFLRAILPINVPPTAAAIRSEARDSLIRAKQWNSAISLALAIIAGYLIFEDSFVGTLADFAAAFVWAFGVDASIEVLMGTLKTKLAVPTHP